MRDSTEWVKQWGGRFSDWVTAEAIYGTEGVPQSLETYGVTSLWKFRYFLRTLSKTCPDVLQSRKIGRHSKFLFGTTVATPIHQQVDADREAARLRETLRDLNKRYKIALSTSTFEQRILDQIHQDVVALPPAPFKAQKLPGIGDQKREEYILNISDCHAGERVSPIDTLGLGGYNFDIFVWRVEQIYKTLAKLHATCLQRTPSKLWVLFNGDIVSGEIHDELARTNDAPITMVVAETAFVFAQLLRDLSAMFPTIEVVCVAASNHPRLAQKPAYKNKWNNWDYLVHRMMEAYCKDIPNIAFDIPRSLHWIGEIGGKTYLLMHGDGIQSWMNIPWYGINRMISKLKGLYAPHGKIIHNIILGHFHTPGSIADVAGEIIINGSFKGVDEFSMGKLGTGNFPAQWYFGTDPDKGITSRYLLHLNGVGTPERYTYERTG